MSRFFARPVMAVSEQVFSMLEAADGKKTIGELSAQTGLADGGRKELVNELLELWSQRFITLRPQSLTSQ
jgi:hypothetical protein